MKKLLSLFTLLGLFAYASAANAPAGNKAKDATKKVKAIKKFKIINDTDAPQMLINMQLSRKSDLSTIEINPTDYELTNPGTVAVILPDDVNKFYYSFEIPTPNKTYSVTGQAAPTPNTYKLKYISSLDIMILNKVS